MTEEKFHYTDGTGAEENDICFYSEDNGSHKYHYADGIYLLKRYPPNNNICIEAFVITVDNAESYIDYTEPLSNILELKYAANDNGVLKELVKIGEYTKDVHMLSKEYAEQNYRQHEKP